MENNEKYLAAMFLSIISLFLIYPLNILINLIENIKLITNNYISDIILYITLVILIIVPIYMYIWIYTDNNLIYNNNYKFD